MSIWQDQSAFGNVASNLTASAQPVVESDALNGHAALKFKRTSSQRMLLPANDFAGLNSFSNFTFVAVVKPSASLTGTTKMGVFGSYCSKDSKAESLLQLRANGYVGGSANKATCSSSGSFRNETWFTVGMSMDSMRESPRVMTYVNGSVTSCGNAAAQVCELSEGKSTVGIGWGYINGPGYFDGQIAEVLIFNKALRIDEYAQINRYLVDKYALDVSDNIHTSFSLSGSGEDLILTNVNTGETEDSLSFGRIPCDCSYGRISDGFAYFDEPTPGVRNGDSRYSEVLEPVRFSVSRGIYEHPFELSLFSEDIEAEIYYTLDHSVPSKENGILFDPTHPIPISKTTIVRAIALKDSALPYNNVASSTYLFLNDVDAIVKPECAEDVWSDSYGDTPASWKVSGSVIADEESKRKLLDSIKACPIVSIVVDDYEMFNPQNGLYTKPFSLDQEKEASVEWLSGNHIFGQEIGLKMHGQWSRTFAATPKKSLRLKFSSKYGNNTLDYPVFSDRGVNKSEFKTLILRGDSNAGTKSLSRYVHDQFMRDVQNSIRGDEYDGTYVQVFINGMYWGLYNVVERPDDDSASRRWGGERDDWNVVKSPYGGSMGLEVRDGESTEIYNLFDKAEKLDFKAASTALSEISEMLDLSDFADYMIMEYWSANLDWPNNNWVTLGANAVGFKYRYNIWDVEKGVSIPKKDIISVAGSAYSPQKLQRKLEASDDYRVLFADRAHALLFNDGALTTGKTKTLFGSLVDCARPLMYAELARWGAYQHDYVSEAQSIQGMNNWESSINTTLNDFLVNRNKYFLQHLRDAGLYPQIDAPEFEAPGKEVRSAKLTIPNAAQVYYTTDGSDPRVAFEGEVSPVAIAYVENTEIMVEETSVIKARALSAAGEWSALSEIELEGSKPELVKNVFLPSINGENWDKAANWSEGAYPNEPGSYAVIGVPTAFKKDKGWRNIHINKSDVTVGHIEITGGSCTNRIDTGKSGNLTFCGKVDVDGVVLEDATFVVMDENDASLAMIDLDEPNKVILGSDTEFVVSNVVGDVKWGGVLAKGIWDGAGHNLAKSGAGRMTLDVTNAPETAFGKIQVAEGAIDITGKIYAEAITKDGICSAALGSTNLATAVDKASELSDKVSVNNVRLFIPSYVGGETYYGAFVANSLTTANTKKGKTAVAYIRDDEGDTWFNEKLYRILPEAEVKTKSLDDGRVTYSVQAPMQDVTIIVDANGKEMSPAAGLSTEDAIRSVKDSGKIVIKGSTDISVDNMNHTITVDDVTYSIADYYDAKIIGKWVQLSFNENAVPHYAETNEGANDALQISEDGVTLGVHTKSGLNYTLQSRASLSDGEWADVMTVSGNDAVQKLESEKLGNAGFYRIIVTD